MEPLYVAGMEEELELQIDAAAGERKRKRRFMGWVVGSLGPLWAFWKLGQSF